ncbi:YceG family protein [Alkaliphilus transvaalensis]|uniref:YceG family protein n=1 Tax=Alkaliphilus transvaalensis TaxID=114628 RepID=UPI0006840451|nr:YceG family protein [Alkaliphilus transvaalensis]
MGDVSFHKLAINTINCKAKNIFEDILVLPKDRRGFAYNNQFMVMPTYFYRIIGLEEEATYEDHLIQLHEKFKELGPLYLKIDKSLDRFIPNDFIQRVNQLWNQVAKINQPTAEAIIELTLKPGILTAIDPIKNKLIKDKLKILLNIFMMNQKNLNIVKNYYIKLLYWIEKYAIPLLKGYKYGEMNPKIIFYGEIQRDEIFFLILLSLMSFDVLYFNTQDGERFGDVPKIEVYSNLIEYSQRSPLKPFPVSTGIKRQETVAYRASVEIDQVLHTEDSGVYRPWQFENYEVIANTLKTTYDELFILWREDARFREGFKAEGNKIYIPNIFAKVSGTLTDLNLYWSHFNSLLEKRESAIFIDKIPFTATRNYLTNRSVFNTDGSLNIEKVKQLPEYKFHYLKTPVQKLILDKMNHLVTSENLFMEHLSPEFKTKILYTILALDKSYLDLIQKFDYPYGIPKVIVFDRDENTFTKEDVIILTFLHFVGFDIGIFTPTGYNNIENGIHQSYYDVHKLEALNFDLHPPGAEQQDKKGFFQKGFKWFFQ